MLSLKTMLDRSPLGVPFASSSTGTDFLATGTDSSSVTPPARLDAPATSTMAPSLEIAPDVSFYTVVDPDGILRCLVAPAISSLPRLMPRPPLRMKQPPSICIADHRGMCASARPSACDYRFDTVDH
ncbi:hypothetical protein GUJ93_ZPchr0003g17884 [Zizania palustris]|uniref:Uncharacterized protein n=1 Tax=Zizania palustris TaxID=103762 RepID=A0A8J5S681_ZIZPA|nr:hypothetical protein GUJ93_ZPchr0003g17884 [Zizania palustris]